MTANALVFEVKQWRTMSCFIAEANRETMTEYHQIKVTLSANVEIKGGNTVLAVHVSNIFYFHRQQM